MRTVAQGYHSRHDRRQRKQNVVYVISFGPELTKVGRTTNWRSRRRALTHSDGLKAVAEAIFHVDPDENLADAEGLALATVAEVHRRAGGGKEWFKAPFDPVLALVASAFANGGILAEIETPNPDEGPGGDLSEMTADHLDHVIRRFAAEHGFPVTKIVRWLGASAHTSVIQRTGFVPKVLADRAERLWKRPALIFEAAAA